jgi:DNA-binding MarR family transcriptional regulator
VAITNWYDFRMSDATQSAHPPALATRVSFLLSQLGSDSAQQFTEHLAPLGIQPVHFGLLVHLARTDGQSQQRLADALGIHRNRMVGLIDDLEHRGLVERRQHPSDRRAHAIYLTPAAHELLPRANRVADDQEAALLNEMDAADRATLIALLQGLAEHTGQRPDVHPGLQGKRRT